ncbi:hemicentin-1-like [Mytilus californianus]|uniref:hemicentin-1-like n=1 Tax=Mytilus californianus TaxID=6549 RepID=UPI00224652C0|nr:hemicentin-1-like [Mytilus californianus]XP_052093033.1 hemicentin-1-like [Mytilus californianus]XP_052093034.1 hemicentin-1-like [Mytilus californianus]
MNLKLDHGVNKLLICLTLLLVPTVIVQSTVPPSEPVITASKNRVAIGETVTLTCSSTLGSPAPSIMWFRGKEKKSSNYSTVGSTTTNTYTFTATKDDMFAVYECRVDNKVTQNPLTRTIFITIYKSLILNAPNTSYTAQTSTNVSLICEVTSGKATGIDWYKDNRQLILALNSHFSMESLKKPNLLITNVQVTDAGVYVCTGTDGYDIKRTNKIDLSVQDPLEIYAPLTFYAPQTSTSVALTCRVTGTADRIDWFKDNQQVNFALNNRFSGGSVQNPSLFIRNVQLSDGGQYVCSATAGTVTKRTSIIRLSPKATPSQPILVGPQSVAAGSSGTWTCTSSGAFPAQTLAMRIGNQLFNNELSTNSLFESFAGTYRVVGRLTWAPSMGHNGQIIYCDVFHPQTLNNKQTASLQLTVRSSLSVTAPNTFYNPAETETVTLACIVTAGNPTEITWKMNNDPLTISGKMSGGTISNPALRISNVAMSDAGNYICEATDGNVNVRAETIRLSPIARSVSEFDIITNILDGYNKLVRPIVPVVKVTHSLVPKEMVEFDYKILVFKAFQCISWNDPRLSWPRGQPRVSLPSSIIWLPDIVMLGQKLIMDFEDKAIITKTGDVTYCPQSMIRSTNCEGMSGDVWECDFKFVSWSYDKVMLNIFLPTALTVPSIDTSMYYEHEDYEIVSKCAKRREMTYPCRKGTYPELTYTFVIRRRRVYCRNLNENPTCNS